MTTRANQNDALDDGVKNNNSNNNLARHGPSYSTNVFYFVPNIIGYIRLSLVLLSWTCHALMMPNWTLALYIAAAILDFFDGFAARRLNQSSVFGAWFDVFIDVVSRTMMWNLIFSPNLHALSTSSSSSYLSVFPWGQLISSLEWLTFVCNHTAHGSRWKTRMMNDASSTSSTSAGSAPPAWVANCFTNGFKSPLGLFVIAGVHGLPPWLYGYSATSFGGRVDMLWPWFAMLLKWNPVVLPFLICGRFYAACVEMWMVLDHIRFLALLKEN